MPNLQPRSRLFRAGCLNIFAAGLVSLYGQSSAGLAGRVLDPSGSPVAGAHVELANPVDAFRRAAETAADGSFLFTGVPFQTYRLSVAAAGFAAWATTVSMRSSVPVQLEVRLGLAAERSEISVSAIGRTLLVNPEETGTRAQMDRLEIERTPVPPGSRGIEAILVALPGFQQNANGAIHPRGAHNQMTFVVDGMPISDQLTGAFANAVDPAAVQTIELHTGNIPAEYGNKVAAVANITTKSGQGTGRLFSGSLSLSAASFDTLSQVTQVAGERGRLAYSLSLNTLRTHRYLDQVALDNLHNGGHSSRFLARLDYSASGRNILRFHVMGGLSPFELANLPSQQAAQMDQRQRMSDLAAATGWVRTVSPRTAVEVNASVRTALAVLSGSPGDTPVTAAQRRRLTTATVANRFSTLRGAHNIRAGVDIQAYLIGERFSFGITGPAFNVPGATDFNPYLVRHDLTRGGSEFRFRDGGSGALYSSYLQDQVRLGPFQLSLGLRFDSYRFLSRGSQWQPRIGVSYHLASTGTVLRLSYNRLYQTPVNENLLLSGSPDAAALAPPAVRAALGETPRPLPPERQNLYEAGVQQAIFGKWSLGVTLYHKTAADQADNNNFFNTGIIFPISLAGIRVNSAEVRLVAPAWRGLSGSLSATHSRAISTPPFTGGLFLGNDAVAALSSGPFVIDHDQALAIHGLVHYTTKRGFYSSLSLRHDSGLVINPSDPAKVAGDPDYAPLLPFLRLDESPARARPRTIAGLSTGYTFFRDARPRCEIGVQVSNLTGASAVYNFQSIFVGTRLVPPRSVGLRLKLFF